ncbi:TRAP transporter substrate-binding protein [Oceanispirochaeta crateris]|uniref:TRAP transporter substrate-binding protein n=1 Tax=Oceanispirochaeta crateris TaxID=2518645 RepID=A0A5C1QIK1_9SPIO|nr:TRAP transporter substrate-binding protein [Oceanispirochaeta crateris]QEN06850.1 TRAP transporter substrate-binding protein [Oceanispirochaeta crateris]
MKKLILMMVLFAMTIPVFSEGAQDSGTEAKKGEYVLKMATPSNPADNNVKAFYFFEKNVEDATNGIIDVQVFDSGQLGDHADYIAGLQIGSIQGAEINTSFLSSIDPAFMIFDLPYIVEGMDHERAVLDAGLDETLSAILEKKANITIGGWMIRSPRSVYSSRGPINTADDFKGLKIRVMDSPIMIRTMELLEATPVPVAASERYMALQTKVVDAAENSPAIVVAQKEFEVTQYLSLTEHFCTPNTIVFDKNFLDSLPAELKTIVLDEAAKAGLYAQDLDQEGLMETLATLESAGMTIVSDVDKASFKKKLQPLYNDYSDQIGSDIIAAFLK